MKTSEETNCLDCLKSSKCFQKLIPLELEFINQNKIQILYAKGEHICKQGSFASYMLYIADGLIRLFLESPSKKNVNIKILKTSEFIGLSSLGGDDFHFYSAVTLRESTLCLIEKSNFRKLLLDNGAFATEMIKWYCLNEKFLFDRILSLGTKRMYGRLADALLYLCDPRFSDEGLFSYLTRKEIAGFAGLSAETTVRILQEFKNEGIIEISGKHIRVLDPDTLYYISRKG